MATAKHLKPQRYGGTCCRSDVPLSTESLFAVLGCFGVAAALLLLAVTGNAAASSLVFRGRTHHTTSLESALCEKQISNSNTL